MVNNTSTKFRPFRTTKTTLLFLSVVVFLEASTVLAAGHKNETKTDVSSASSSPTSSTITRITHPTSASLVDAKNETVQIVTSVQTERPITKNSVLRSWKSASKKDSYLDALVHSRTSDDPREGIVNLSVRARPKARNAERRKEYVQGPVYVPENERENLSSAGKISDVNRHPVSTSRDVYSAPQRSSLDFKDDYGSSYHGDDAGVSAKYGPPQVAYGSLQNVYGPPQNAYGPPQNAYGPPRNNYDAYGPPQNTHGPPQNTYGPPQNTYGPPQNTYGPPRNNYDAYGPPRDSYGPPQAGYGPPNKKHKQFAPVQHGYLDESPANSYLGPQQAYGPPIAHYDAYSLPEHHITLPSIGFSWPFALKLNAFTLAKILLKLIIFKMIVKFIAVICLLLFIPKLEIIKKGNKVGSGGGGGDNDDDDEDDDDMSRNMNATYPSARRLNELTVTVLEAREKYAALNKTRSDAPDDCTTLGCRIRRVLLDEQTGPDYLGLFKSYVTEERRALEGKKSA